MTAFTTPPVCLQCRAEGVEPTRIYENNPMYQCVQENLFLPGPYWENGKRHQPPTRKTYVQWYRCSNRHEWKVEQPIACSCGEVHE